MCGLSSFGWPLVIGGGLNSLYDLLLLFMFRKVRPPEEHALADLGYRQSSSPEQAIDPSVTHTYI